MIKPSSNNRTIIKGYLNKLSEDDFIDKIIIPLFSKNGYILYTRKMHGPGEHGQDIIFYRNVPLFYDHEYISVQAKAEKVTASNVGHFALQLIRALRIPFPGKAGSTDKYSNYVMFMNSKDHTNDANFEFPYLIDGKDNIKILSQENIVELIITNDFVPDDLIKEIELYEVATSTYETEIRDIIYSDNLKSIRYLLDTQLKIETRKLSEELKGLIINYIFHKWNEDKSWEGTVEPMRWLNSYFDFIQPNQYEKLFQVVEEYTSIYFSKAARADTEKVIKKITPTQVETFKDSLIQLAAIKVGDIKKYPEIIEWISDLDEKSLNRKNKNIVTLFLSVIKLDEEISKIKDKDIKEAKEDEYEVKKRELMYLIFPERRHK